MSTIANRPGSGRVLAIWTPEDKAFWEREGDAVAKINLWISVPALFRRALRTAKPAHVNPSPRCGAPR